MTRQNREKTMQTSWTKDALTRRIDRCYLVAARTRIAEKRQHYISLAREHRAVLAVKAAASWHGQHA
jgi:hypothetical protein